MFLFTTSDPRNGRASAPVAGGTRQGSAQSPIIDAIRHGAGRTGAGFDYLVKTAQRESALDPGAKAKTSSASGLFQFVEQTWLGTIKTEGEKYGLGSIASAISEQSGHYSVDDPRKKREILELRHDPKVSAIVAGALARRNREQLVGALGRDPNASDLYVAHVLGAGGAQSLIRAAQRAPSQSAADQFPEAAAANRPIFFDRAGRARSVAEVYAILAANHAASVVAPLTVTQAGHSGAHDSRKEGPATHGLFGTEGRRAPVSDMVTKLWTTGPRREPVELAAAVVGFFPRTETGAVPIDQPALSDEAPRLVDLPLPPRRPMKFAGAVDEPAGIARSPSTFPGGR